MADMKSVKPKMIKKDLAPGVVPDTTPEIAVREYMISKCEARRSKRMPDWDEPPQTPAIQLVQARRDLKDAEYKLQEKWMESLENREKLEKQWVELRESEESLRQAFIQFNKFVKENREKCERANRKIDEEHELQKHRDEEAAELRLKVEELGEVRKTMEKHVLEHTIYENYLKDVISELREFPTVFDVIKRYEALRAARDELTERQERALVALEEANRSMNRLTEEKTQVIMGLNNKLAELQSRYDFTKAEALRWESALSHIKHTSSEKALELERVRTTCWTMYQNICRRRKMEPTVEENDVEEQLITIKRTIHQLKKIVRVARRRSAREAASQMIS